MIQVNLNKAKEIAHDKRRHVRAELLKDLDILTTIPSEAEKAEAKREEIRQEYAEIQTEIDKATNLDELKIAISPCL